MPDKTVRTVRVRYYAQFIDGYSPGMAADTVFSVPAYLTVRNPATGRNTTVRGYIDSVPEWWRNEYPTHPLYQFNAYTYCKNWVLVTPTE